MVVIKLADVTQPPQGFLLLPSGFLPKNTDGRSVLRHLRKSEELTYNFIIKSPRSRIRSNLDQRLIY